MFRKLTARFQSKEQRKRHKVNRARIEWSIKIGHILYNLPVVTPLHPSLMNECDNIVYP